MGKNKPYFAQNNKCDATNHRAKYFNTLEEAKVWLEEQGGGTIKQRNTRTIHVFGKPLQVWGEVCEIKGKSNESE